jgi:hypothetical protein
MRQHRLYGAASVRVYLKRIYNKTEVWTPAS